MKTSIQIQTFFSLMNTKLSQTLSKISRKLKYTLFRQSPPLPVSLTSTNTSIAQEVHSTTVGVPVPADQQNLDRPEKINWAMIVIGFCMESAVDIALQTPQNHIDQNINHDQNFSSFHLLSMLILFTFAALFVAIFMRHKFRITAQVLEGVGLLLAVSAFCYAVSIPFPHELKCITWSTFGISLLAVLICKYCF
ncbi:hypothetical protein L484_005327 [Morus notabilis]|uniref:Uncharacterized protein n=1 Tax=Morus notabilis TaxID=981085 RepID=W9RXQ7_9ROSA|nr:hypothetical protein L484_005327 [Morus notabilis]